MQTEEEEENNSLLRNFGSAFLRKTLMSGLLPEGLRCKGSRWLVDSWSLKCHCFLGGDQFV